MSGVFFDIVIHGLGSFICFMISRKCGKKRIKYAFSMFNHKYIKILESDWSSAGLICNSNWSEWSTIQGVIGRVISNRHDVCNCTITAQTRPADDQSDSRILI